MHMSEYAHQLKTKGAAYFDNIFVALPMMPKTAAYIYDA